MLAARQAAAAPTKLTAVGSGTGWQSTASLPIVLFSLLL
jgi:hypothetical protein